MITKGSYWNAPIDTENRYRQKVKRLFFAKYPKTSKFKDITDERKDEIYLKASLWNEDYPDLPIRKKLTILYETLSHRNNDLGLNGNDETFLFLIAAFDPELKMMELAYDCNRKDELETRCFRELGFEYDERLYILEIYCNKRFNIVEDEYELKKTKPSNT